MPAWIEDQFGADALAQWEAIFNSCNDRGGDNCGAQATGVIEKRFGKAIAQKTARIALARRKRAKSTPYSYRRKAGVHLSANTLKFMGVLKADTVVPPESIVTDWANQLDDLENKYYNSMLDWRKSTQIAGYIPNLESYSEGIRSAFQEWSRLLDSLDDASIQLSKSIRSVADVVGRASSEQGQ